MHYALRVRWVRVTICSEPGQVREEAAIRSLCRAPGSIEGAGRFLCFVSYEQAFRTSGWFGKADFPCVLQPRRPEAATNHGMAKRISPVFCPPLQSRHFKNRISQRFSHAPACSTAGESVKPAGRIGACASDTLGRASKALRNSILSFTWVLHAPFSLLRTLFLALSSTARRLRAS